MTSARSGRPKQRTVAADVLLSTRWISGTLLVPGLQSLTDYLHTAGAFVKLTDASVPGLDHAAEFLALQRTAISLVAPSIPEDHVEAEGGAGITSPWRIACIFEQGILHGRLDFLVNLRLSDYLRQQTGFLVVRDGVWTETAGLTIGAPSVTQWPVVLVNLVRTLGVVEDDNPREAGHPGRLPSTEWGD